jgi:uncharacterized protein YcfJ
MAILPVTQIAPRRAEQQTKDNSFGQFAGALLGGIAGFAGGGPAGAAGGALAGSQIGSTLQDTLAPPETPQQRSVSLKGAVEALRTQPEPIRKEFSDPIVRALIMNEGQGRPK